jgi:hypothetical protein
MRIDVIRVDDTYDSIISDLFLYDGPKTSLYGMGVVSDHALFQNQLVLVCAMHLFLNFNSYV